MPHPAKLPSIKTKQQSISVRRPLGHAFETNGGAATAMDMAFYPTGKSATDDSAIRLCIAGGGRIVQMKQGAACPA